MRRSPSRLWHPSNKAALEQYREDIKAQAILIASPLTARDRRVHRPLRSNPLTGAKLPVWASDYVLADYGTGAIMAVPAHDQRDLEFALKFDLPIVKVLDVEGAEDPATSGVAAAGDGVLINSGELTGLPKAEAIARLLSWLRLPAPVRVRSFTVCVTGCYPASVSGVPHPRNPL